jgi:hypothetical protein
MGLQRTYRQYSMMINRQRVEVHKFSWRIEICLEDDNRRRPETENLPQGECAVWQSPLTCFAGSLQAEKCHWGGDEN